MARAHFAVVGAVHWQIRCAVERASLDQAGCVVSQRRNGNWNDSSAQHRHQRTHKMRFSASSMTAKKHFRAGTPSTNQLSSRLEIVDFGNARKSDATCPSGTSCSSDTRPAVASRRVGSSAVKDPSVVADSRRWRNLVATLQSPMCFSVRSFSAVPSFDICASRRICGKQYDTSRRL